MTYSLNCFTLIKATRVVKNNNIISETLIDNIYRDINSIPIIFLLILKMIYGIRNNRILSFFIKIID